MIGTAAFAGPRALIQKLFEYIEGGDDLTEILSPSISLENISIGRL
jgi:hypothetical protein